MPGAFAHMVAAFYGVAKITLICIINKSLLIIIFIGGLYAA